MGIIALAGRGWLESESQPYVHQASLWESCTRGEEDLNWSCESLMDYGEGAAPGGAGGREAAGAGGAKGGRGLLAAWDGVPLAEAVLNQQRSTGLEGFGAISVQHWQDRELVFEVFSEKVI